MSSSNPEPDDATSETAHDSVEFKRSPADLHLESLPLSELGDAEALARRLVDEDYVATVSEARIAAAELIALAKAARTTSPEQAD